MKKWRDFQPNWEILDRSSLIRVESIHLHFQSSTCSDRVPKHLNLGALRSPMEFVLIVDCVMCPNLTLHFLGTDPSKDILRRRTGLPCPKQHSPAASIFAKDSSQAHSELELDLCRVVAWCLDWSLQRTYVTKVFFRFKPLKLLNFCSFRLAHTTANLDETRCLHCFGMRPVY